MRMDRNEEEMVTNDSDPLLKRENEEAESSSQLTPPKPATLSALEIEDEETDGSSAGCCRICLETDSELGEYPMYHVQLGCFVLIFGNAFSVGNMSVISGEGK